MEDQAPCPTPNTAREQEIAQAANKLASQIHDWLLEHDVDMAVGLIAVANVLGHMAAVAAAPGKSGPLLVALYRQADMERTATRFSESLDRAGLSALKPGQRS